MLSILERLIVVCAPLFATAAGTRKPAKKTVRKEKKTTRTPAKKQRPAKKPAAPVKAASAKKSSRAKPAPPKSRTGVTNKPASTAGAQTSAVVQPTKTHPPAGRAILLSPENEKFTDSLYPKFRWLSVGNSTRYEVAWGEDQNFVASASLISIATEAPVPVEKPLRLGTTYYWRVRGGNERGWGPWSSTLSFRVLDETE